MSRDVNFVVIDGRLGKDPETTYTQSGKALSKFSLATSKWNFREKKAGEAQWHNIQAWEEMAERMADAEKGDRVIVTGELLQQKWEDKKTGQMVYKTVVNAATVAIDKSRQRKRDDNEEDRPRRAERTESRGRREREDHGDTITDEDIPF